ncbi:MULTISPECIES: polysaccharide deacetylase family protein [unclassified Methylobacterium]|jgi:peptidoglycan/xylan/chitin deacetylase (PgdA/CDA1 family)|uniref:polysaccharide deacetylase family protein n=1 Tax=unclassified Methylobacterium TaxID=2615210 RepID=UPI0013532851|nr:polysaccharide deacetylase family protein [Methylobacterium sp. 2A]MWV24709.1 polysaccharide deacetylase family protein [Methylobacterium sp. 2A]
MSGTLVISLDFELYWGVRDRRRLEEIRSDLLATRQVIPAMLALFERYGVRATWATVGFLFFETRARLLRALPAAKPTYSEAKYSPYGEIAAIGVDESSDPCRLGRSLVELIAAHAGQEIGTHTFCHYFALEAGQTPEAFRQDLAAAVAAANRAGHEVRSLVFPRNQCNAEYLPLCDEAGIACFRGNPRSWLYRARPRGEERRVLRALRLLDAYVNISGHHTYRRTTPGTAGRPLDVPASRFLRPWSSRLRWLEGLRLRRIKSAMTHAARRGEVFHLWWHPENFGTDCAQNLRCLEVLLRHFASLRERYGMESLNMGDFGSASVNLAKQARG